jgi:hypothetical protein
MTRVLEFWDSEVLGFTTKITKLTKKSWGF